MSEPEIAEACDCLCHRWRGVVHSDPCCAIPSLGSQDKGFAISWQRSDRPDFTHYEISRSESGMGWDPLTTVPTITVTHFVDWELHHGVQVSYRIRVCGSNGCGPWVSLQPELA